jgi:hypothetical protein
MSTLKASLFRPRVVGDADRGAIARVIVRFQKLNVLPRRLLAEFGIDEIIHIEMDVFGIPEEQIRGIASKIASATSILSAQWRRIASVRNLNALTDC